MSLTFILDDGHIESIGIDPLGPNAVSLPPTFDLSRVTTETMNRRLTSFFLPFFLYISTFTCEDYKNKSPGDINIEADKNKSQEVKQQRAARVNPVPTAAAGSG